MDLTLLCVYVIEDSNNMFNLFCFFFSLTLLLRFCKIYIRIPTIHAKFVYIFFLRLKYDPTYIISGIPYSSISIDIMFGSF